MARLDELWIFWYDVDSRYEVYMGGWHSLRKGVLLMEYIVIIMIVLLLLIVAIKAN